MAKVTEEQVERTRDLIAAIPPGRVRTYGDIAADAGLSSPRLTAWVLRTDGGGLPWFRVITATGRPAASVRSRQLELLAAEGVPIVDGRVDLRSARLRPEEAGEPAPDGLG